MENAFAAVPLTDSSSYLSAHQFQKLLSTWFEDKGVLSELRSQLRFKMVNALRNTVIGRDICKRSVRMSLSKQAVNLIVAEYLMQNKYHYSLSIFNTEASLTNVLPDYPVIFANVTEKESEVCHFDEENILNILELIGIAKTSIYCDELLTSYFSDQEHHPLLSCLINLLCKLTRKYSEEPSSHDLDAELIDLQKECTFIKEVGNILFRADLSRKNLKAFLDNIKSLYETENQNLEKEHSKLTSELKMKIKNQEAQITELQKTNKLLEKHFMKVNKEYRKVKLHVKNLVSHGEMLKQTYERTNKNVKDFSNNVTNNLKENKAIPNPSTVLKTQNILVCQLPHCTEVCQANIRRAEDLSKENTILDEENKQQKERIKKLSIKYTQLTHELTDCQSKINLLNSRINEGNTRELISNFLYEDNRRRIEKVHPEQNENSDTTSDSVTEEILVQARSRLQKLEQESDEIEKKFRNLHQGIHTFEFN